MVGLVQTTRTERDLTDELRTHLELHIQHNIRAGIAGEARRQASIALGGVDQTRGTRTSVASRSSIIATRLRTIFEPSQEAGFTAAAV
jgi:hypothetical protein